MMGNKKQRIPRAKRTLLLLQQNHSLNKKKIEELPIVDTGQTWFRVKITKNDSAYMDYEGSWPVFFLSNNSATLQLSKSKAIMSITDILTLYMNGMPSGTVPIVPSNREKRGSKYDHEYRNRWCLWDSHFTYRRIFDDH